MGKIYTQNEVYAQLGLQNMSPNFCFCQSDRGKKIYQGGLNFPSFYYDWGWTSFYVFVSYLCILFLWALCLYPFFLFFFLLGFVTLLINFRCSFWNRLTDKGASQVVLVVKNLPANAGDTGDAGLIPGWGRSPGVRAWQPTPVLLPGESPWTEELGRLQSIGLQRAGHFWSSLAHTYAQMKRTNKGYQWNEGRGRGKVGV